MKESASYIKEYLEECHVFFLATVQGQQPRVRPLFSMYLLDGRLYLVIARNGSAYVELSANNHVEISSMHPDKTWMRLTAVLEEEHNHATCDALCAKVNGDLRTPWRIPEDKQAYFRIERGKAIIESTTNYHKEYVI